MCWEEVRGEGSFAIDGCCPCHKDDGNLKSIKDMRICIIYPQNPLPTYEPNHRDKV